MHANYINCKSKQVSKVSRPPVLRVWIKEPQKIVQGSTGFNVDKQSWHEGRKIVKDELETP